MFKQVVSFSLLIVVLNHSLHCDALRNSASRGYSSKYGTKNREPVQPKTLASSSLPGQNQNTARRGLGLSAWGIVTVIVSIIMAIVGADCDPATTTIDF